MNKVKLFLKNLPGIKYLWNKVAECRLSRQSVELRFTNIFLKNGWGDNSSISGTGSNLEATEVIRVFIDKLVKDYNIKTVLDIPCGDFYWMKSVNFNGVKYIGADIVKPLIDNNKEKYGNLDKVFCQLDLIKDELAKVDLVICRDCLVHLSNEDIKKSIVNIVKSKSKYLLTTTFPEHMENKDIITGRWRAINLNMIPFNFPKAILEINEGRKEGEEFADKTLALWKIDELGIDII